MGPLGRQRLTVVRPLGAVVPVRAERTNGQAPADLGFLDLVEMFCTLRILEAWKVELRLLLCDDARVESIAARAVAGPESTIEAMRFAAAGNAYTVREFEVETLGAEAALVSASISHDDQQVLSVMTRVNWVVSGRDGLIWRARIVATRQEAERILESYGPDLGL